uniref:BCL6 corepressor n=1 Tax=Takifugu rubripes TaxID=31033 RepID=A0A3B5K1A0_TAKRU
MGKDILNYATVGRPSELCPPPKSKLEQQRIPSSELKKVSLNNKGDIYKSPGKHNTTSVKVEVPEIQCHHKQKQSLRLENGTSSSPIYGESYLPPGLSYTSRYIPYSVAENISLQNLATGKVPIYTQLGLLGTSFYPPRMAANHGMPYGIHPNHGEDLIYPNSQSMALSSISSLPCSDPQEFNDETRNSELYKYKGRLETEKFKKSDNEKHSPSNEMKKGSSKSMASAKDDVFIDLVHDETEADSSTSRNLLFSNKNSDFSTKGGSSSNHIQERMTKALDLQATKPKQEQLLDSTQPRLPDPNTSQHQTHCEDISGELEPLSPLLDIPEQETMQDKVLDCNENQRSIISTLATSSSGDGGDRFKSVTTHGLADSSKLSREQQGLQVRSVLAFPLSSSSHHESMKL